MLFGAKSGTGSGESVENVLVITGFTVIGFVTTFDATVLSGDAVWNAHVSASKSLLHPGVAWHALESVCGVTVLGAIGTCYACGSSKVVILSILTLVISIDYTFVGTGIEFEAFKT